jgi:plasmid stabilization system protein ParE
MEIPGLGERFFKNFETTKEKLAIHPNHYSLITNEVRRCPIKKFPYSILYIIEEEKIIILAIIHRKRSNAFIRKRIGRKE